MKDDTVRERYSGKAEELLLSLIEKNLPKERRLYTSQLVCWLMVSSFLYEAQTLTGSVKETFKEGCRRLMGNCQRKRRGVQSENTSALSQARTTIPIRHFQELLYRLHDEIQDTTPLWQGRRAYLIDGTSFTTEPTKRLRAEYPSGQNQHGRSHFPVVFLTVAHDLQTGVAEEPEWGAMYGEERDTEVAQTKRVFPRLPKGSVVVSDRGHGIFSVVQSARKNELDVVYRMADSRVGRLFKDSKLKNGADISFDWHPSSHDLKANPEVLEEAVPGRLLVQDVTQNGKSIRLYLFTTLSDVPAAEIIKLYGRRWEVESEIRDLKKILSPANLKARTPTVLERQIYAAVISYNLIRAIMLMAAKTHGIENPKRLSFANAMRVVREHTYYVMHFDSPKKRKDSIDEMLYWIAARENKPRPGRSFPRTVHKRSTHYKRKDLLKDSESL